MGVEIVKEEGAVFGVNLGHPIVTNGILCMRGGDAALPKLLWDFLFLLLIFLKVKNVTGINAILHVRPTNSSCLLKSISHSSESLKSAYTYKSYDQKAKFLVFKDASYIKCTCCLCFKDPCCVLCIKTNYNAAACLCLQGRL